MTEFLKSNPTALRHCILYQFLQQKSFDEAFHDFCETVGPGVINKKEFQSWFDRLGLGKFNHKKELADMREVLRNDKQALRACVMYEWLTTKSMELVRRMKSLWCKNGAFSLFTKYINFCKVIGDDVMEYREFDIWFYRFEKGNFDLNYEMDKDEKILELSDMPIDIMKNVVEYCDTFDRVSLAKTSRSFKTFIEDQKSFPKMLYFEFDSRNARISFENRTILTMKSRQVYSCYRRSGKQYLENERLIEGVPYWKQGIQELGSLLKYPKLQLKEFNLKLYTYLESNENTLKLLDGAVDALESALKPIQQLHVKQITFHAYSMNPLLKILPSLKPGYLTTISIYVPKSESFLLEELVQMEQWKQAKCCSIFEDLFDGLWQHLYHFEELVFGLNRLSVENIRQVKEILLKSSNLENCFIRVFNSLDIDVIRDEFGDAIEENPDTQTKTYNYLIPNSMEYFEIKCTIPLNFSPYPTIEITRKKK